MEKCNACRFWKEDEKSRDPNDEDWAFGHCRRRPPAVISHMVAALLPKLSYGQQEDPDLSIEDRFNASIFPATFATDWCGEYVGEVV